MGGRVTLWSFVGEANGAGNTARVDGRMDSRKYQKNLEANVPQSVKKLKVKRGYQDLITSQ